MIGSEYFEKGDLLNICVYHVDYWQHLLDENFVWAVMCCYLPKESTASFFFLKDYIPQLRNFCVKFVTDVLKELRAFKPEFSLTRLKKSVLQDAAHNQAKGKNRFSNLLRIIKL